MSRGIKFRAWDEIGKWIGNVTSFDFDEGAVFIETKNSDDENRFEINNVPVMQYTGLKDKNGKEMYFDSDVVKVSAWHGYIAPSVCMSTLDVIDGIDSAKYEYTGLIQKDEFGNPFVKDFYFANLLDADKYEFEVVGNIYENPELLECD